MGLDQLNFIHGVELENEDFLFTAQFKAASPDQHHSSFLSWDEESGYGEIDRVMRSTVAMAVGENGDTMIALSPDGIISEIGKGIGEATKPAGEEPLKHSLRCVKKIGKSLYVTGVQRQCYMRTERGAWKSISSDEMQETSSPKSFESIDGFSDTEVYAVGWDGEIWTYNGESWKEIKNPIDRMFYDICVGEEKCLAVGQSGKILLGRGDDWKEIEQSETFSGENFWSTVYFKGAFYLGSERGIYKLENEKFSVFSENDHQAICNLFVGPSGLWSLSLNEVKRFDGNEWRTAIES